MGDNQKTQALGQDQKHAFPDEDRLFHRAAVEAGYAPLREYVESRRAAILQYVGRAQVMITDEMAEAALDAWYGDDGNWRDCLRSSPGFPDRCREEMRAALEAALAKMPSCEMPKEYRFLKQPPKTPADFGWNARILGASIESRPYPFINSPGSIAWRRGFEEAGRVLAQEIG